MIQLPLDLFFGTTVATCISVLKKSKRDDSILSIDASDRFERSGNKNKLNDEDRQHIRHIYDEGSFRRLQPVGNSDRFGSRGNAESAETYRTTIST